MTTAVRDLRVLVSSAITGSEGGGLGEAGTMSIRLPIMAHVAGTSPTSGGGSYEGRRKTLVWSGLGGSRSRRVSGKVRVIGSQV